MEDFQQRRSLRMNKVVLLGRLVKDIELRYTESNVAVGNLTLAVKRRIKNTNGEYESDFINCTSFLLTSPITLSLVISEQSSLIIDFSLPAFSR